MTLAVVGLNQKSQICDFVTARQTLAEYRRYLGGPDFAFAERVYGQNPKMYRSRLQAIGFEGLTHVLDAGCGFGQWSLLLAELNGHLSACDISGERLIIAANICRKIGVTNCEFGNGPLNSLPYDSGVFDGLFCYGVIHATPWKESLRQCARVLKPGGRLYVTANGLGWYLHCWKNEPHRRDNYDPRLASAQSLVSTVQYERSGWFDANGLGLIIDQNEMLEQLRQIGFQIIGHGNEGSINVTGIAAAESFFRGEYEGHAGVFEVLAVKE